MKRAVNQAYEAALPFSPFLYYLYGGGLRMHAEGGKAAWHGGEPSTAKVLYAFYAL